MDCSTRTYIDAFVGMFMLVSNRQNWTFFLIAYLLRELLRATEQGECFDSIFVLFCDEIIVSIIIALCR